MLAALVAMSKQMLPRAREWQKNGNKVLSAQVLFANCPTSPGLSL